MGRGRGGTGGFPRRSPLRTVGATHRGTRLMQAARAWLVEALVPALAGEVPAVAGGVYEAGFVIVPGPGFPVMGEVVGRYRPAGELQPPVFPCLPGIGGLFGGPEMIPPQWAARGLP